MAGRYVLIFETGASLNFVWSDKPLSQGGREGGRKEVEDERRNEEVHAWKKKKNEQHALWVGGPITPRFCIGNKTR